MAYNIGPSPYKNQERSISGDQRDMYNYGASGYIPKRPNTGSFAQGITPSYSFANPTGYNYGVPKKLIKKINKKKKI